MISEIPVQSVAYCIMVSGSRAMENSSAFLTFLLKRTEFKAWTYQLLAMRSWTIFFFFFFLPL